MRLSAYTQKILAGVIAAGVPVAYMVGLHIKWMQDPQERIRMALKHVGFWGGMTMGLIGLHKWVIRKRNPLLLDLGLSVGLAALPIAGYEGFRRLAKRFFPSIKPAMPVLHDPMFTPPASQQSIVEMPKPQPPPQQPSIPNYAPSSYPSYTYSSYGASYPYAYYGWNPYQTYAGTMYP